MIPALEVSPRSCPACHVWMFGDGKSRLRPNLGKYNVAAFLARDPPTQALETASDLDFDLPDGPRQRQALFFSHSKALLDGVGEICLGLSLGRAPG